MKIRLQGLFRCGYETQGGVACIANAHGTFERPSISSYDILIEEENMLYKHVSSKMTITYNKEN